MNTLMQFESPVRARRKISLTPLIDVVFILLLFFMLTTQFNRQQAITLSVPGERASGAEPQTDRVLVSLSAEGQVTLDGSESLPLHQLGGRLLEQRVSSGELPSLLVRVDDDVDLQLFTTLMDVVAGVGVVDVTVRGLQ